MLEIICVTPDRPKSALNELHCYPECSPECSPNCNPSYGPNCNPGCRPTSISLSHPLDVISSRSGLTSHDPCGPDLRPECPPNHPTCPPERRVFFSPPCSPEVGNCPPSSTCGPDRP